VAEPTPLHPTPTRLALLADVDALKVADDADGTPMLDCGDGETARVAELVWTMYRAGWICQPGDTLGWRLTDAGRAVLEAGDTAPNPPGGEG